MKISPVDFSGEIFSFLLDYFCKISSQECFALHKKHSELSMTIFAQCIYFELYQLFMLGMEVIYTSAAASAAW